MLRFLAFLPILASLFIGCLLLSCQPKPSLSSKEKGGHQKVTDARVDELVRECQVCHGVKEAQRGPILDGMEYSYLFDQLQKFRSGIRGQNPQNRSEYLMGIGARKIQNDVEAAYLAEWFSRQPPKPALYTVSGDLKNGKDFYESRCASCHGQQAEGNRLVAGPSLNRLEGWYFLDQMRKFQGDFRGYHPLDERGRVMAASAKDISDRTLRDVVAYVVESFGPPEQPSSREW